MKIIIDAMGGVYITVTDAEADYLNRYRISRDSTTPSMGKGGTYLFTQGTHEGIEAGIRMGRTAKGYVLARLHDDGVTRPHFVIRRISADLLGVRICRLTERHFCGIALGLDKCGKE